MLSEEMQQAVTEVSAGDVVVALQVIARAAASGALKDYELKVIGTAREHLVMALQTATGVNFDQARAAQVAEHQRKMAEAQRRAQEQRARATKLASDPKSENSPVANTERAPEGTEAQEAVMANRVPQEVAPPDADPVLDQPEEGGQDS